MWTENNIYATNNAILTLLARKIGTGSNITGVNTMMSVCRIAHSSLYHGNDVCPSSAISYHKIRSTQNTPCSTSSCFTVYRLLLLSTSMRINARSNYLFEATLISKKRLIIDNPPTTSHNRHRLAGSRRSRVADLCLAADRPAATATACWPTQA